MNRFVPWAVGVFVLSGPACLWAQGQPPATVQPNTSNLTEWSSQMSYLAEPSVQQELKLTAEQIEELQRIRSTVRPGVPRLDDRAAQLAAMEKSLTEGRKRLDALLKPEQASRLRQIGWQQRRVFGLASLITIQEMRAELKFSDERSNQLRTLQQKLADERRGLDRSDRAAYTAKNRELVTASDQEVEKLLTAEQNTKLKELLGPAFMGQILQPFFGGGPPSGGSGGAPRAFPFSLGTAIGPSLTLLRGAQAQQELKLTVEQKQKVAALPTSTRTVPATLLEFLAPPQRERLQQLTLQYALQRYGPLGWLRHKSAVDALALTEEQRRKIAEIGREDVAAVAALQGTNAPDKVAAIDRETSDKLNQALSEEQRAKRKQLVGELFPGQLQAGFASRDGGSRGGPSVEAQPQPSPASSTYADTLTLTGLLALLSETSVQQELQLSAEQMGKIEPLRATSGFPSESATARQAERKKQLDTLLKPEQAARLQQILRQQRRTLGLVAVTSFADVQTALKLTAEQSTQLIAVRQWFSLKRRPLSRDDTEYAAKNQELIATADREIEGLLNAEQNARLKELLGPPFTGPISQTSRGYGYSIRGFSSGVRSTPFSLGTLAGPSLTLLRGQQAQQDLKLTAEQKQKVAALPTPTPPDPAALLDFLTPPQRERLGQLTLQYALQRFGPLGWLRYKSAVDSLTLSEEERQKIEEIARDDAAALKALGSPPLPSQLAAADRQTAEKLNQALSEEQRAKRTQLVGKLFPGQLRAGTPNRDAIDWSRPIEGGSLTRSPWLYLTYPDVQKDLQITDEQRQKLNLGQPFRAPRPEEIQAALTAEQFARLAQIQLQSFQQRSGPASIFRYRDVVEAVAVTEEQKESLAAVADGIGVGNGRTAEQQVAEILTDEQEAKLKTLLGPPFAGEIPRFAGGQVEFQIASTSQSPGGWMRYPAVREDLKLSAEQTQKANAILERERTIPPDKLAELLNAEQLTRLREVQRQLVFRQSGAAALFRYREVAEPLALSDEQKRKIEQLARANNPLRLPLDAGQQTRSQLNEILTAEQRSKFDELLGKPFEGDLGRGNPLSPARSGERQRPSR